MSFLRSLSIFVLLVVAAAAFRFAKLGEWPFEYDEIFTLLEARVLMGEQDVPEFYLQDGKYKPEETQIYRLPHLIPASYFVNWVGYRLFGDGEFGARTLMAVIGSLNVGIVFLLARPLFGLSGALILSFTLLLWPDHILNSQNNRFYAQSFLFFSVIQLLGGYITVKHSVRATVWIGPLAVLAVLSNSFGGLIWGIILAGITLQLVMEKRAESNRSFRGIFSVLGFWSLLLIGIALFHIFPLAAGWNSGSAPWGYTSFHALLATINRLGWPLSLLAVLGFLMMLADFRKPGNVYWIFCAIASFGCVIMLPLKIVFYPWYCFLFSFPFLVASAYGVRQVYQLLRDHLPVFGRAIAVFWILVCVVFNFPTLASYYRDGGRLNNRAAFYHIRDYWREGDRMTGMFMGTADWYVPEQSPKIPLRSYDVEARLQEMIDLGQGGNGRLWIILHRHRGGLDDNLRRWLGRHTTFEVSFGKKRFDYQDFYVEVYLFTPETNE